jgi:hypothetical protein
MLQMLACRWLLIPWTLPVLGSTLFVAVCEAEGEAERHVYGVLQLLQNIVGRDDGLIHYASNVDSL